MNDKPRKSLRQLALEAAQVDGVDLWACPRCGCKDWRVRKTWHPAGGIRRSRVCRHCGQGTMLTTEVPVPDGHRVVVVPPAPTEDDGHI